MKDKFLLIFFFIFVLLSITQIGQHWWPEFSLVRGVRVDYLAPTIYASDLLLLAMLGLVVGTKLRKEKLISWRWGMFGKVEWVVWLGSLALLIVPVVVAERPLLALYWLGRYFQVGVVGILTLFFFRRVRNRGQKVFFVALLIGMLFSIFLGLTQMILEKDTGFLWIVGERPLGISDVGISTLAIAGRMLLRPYATFPHPNALAGWLLIAGALIFYPETVFLKKEARTAAKFFWAVGLVATGSRTVLLAIGISLLFLMAQGNGSLFSFFVTYAPNSLMERGLLTVVGFREFIDHPWFGVGPGNFIVTLPQYLPTGVFLLQPVHNVFLLFLSEFGLLGTLGLLGLFGRKFIRKVAVSAPIAFWILLLITGLFDHYWITSQQNRILLGLVFGYLQWKGECQKS